MNRTMRRWMLGLAMLVTLAVSYAPADAQVIVVGPHRRHHRHHYYRHGRRY